MSILREPTLLKVQIVQSIVIAALTGVFYLNDSYTQEKVANINGSLFQMVVNMAFMFQFAVVNHFCSEIHTFYREYGSGLYSAGSYFIAKNLAEVIAMYHCTSYTPLTPKMSINVAAAELHSVRGGIRVDPVLDVAPGATLAALSLLLARRCPRSKHCHLNR
ncbi:hypothetical protein ANCCAN_04395 [Ancylostoma caninum]|uniref:ABC-2 type transporter transmembrane domain-containing protein n=1 Tax=Ancylostoma caninum TaxID=29170 RepID=A0A368GYP5_ANCCA|nr:hypothetical protein ANCCAN_04395 [Ancylostoma caninum]